MLQEILALLAVALPNLRNVVCNVHVGLGHPVDWSAREVLVRLRLHEGRVQNLVTRHVELLSVLDITQIRNNVHAI